MSITVYGWSSIVVIQLQMHILQVNWKTQNLTSKLFIYTHSKNVKAEMRMIHTTKSKETSSTSRLLLAKMIYTLMPTFGYHLEMGLTISN